MNKNFYLKLTRDGVRGLAKLNSAGESVFMAVFDLLEKAHNKVYIDFIFRDVDQSTDKMSETTFYKGVKSMLDNGFMIRSDRLERYIINKSFIG